MLFFSPVLLLLCGGFRWGFSIGENGEGIFVRDGRFFVYWANEKEVDITKEGIALFFFLVDSLDLLVNKSAR